MQKFNVHDIVKILNCDSSIRNDYSEVVKPLEEGYYLVKLSNGKKVVVSEWDLSKVNDNNGFRIEKKEEPVAKSEFFDSHYSAMAVQPIELMQMFMTEEEFIGYLKGNILKYSMRAGKKNGEPVDKDMSKAKRYMEWYKKALQGEKIDPRK